MEPSSGDASDEPRECRWIVDPPLAGVWNMAVDEALLAIAASSGSPTLRFYQWSEPTLSLGYFQSAAARREHPASQACAVVRRTSGGGAILHDRELTYSLTLPSAALPSSGARALYDAMHEGLVALLQRRRIPAERVTAARRRDEPFLCFARHSSGDVLVAGHKVAGSAQRRQRGAVLQHGSLLLGRSASAPELPGLTELTGAAFSAAEIADDWRRETARRLNLRLVAGSLSAEELALVRTELFERFDRLSWTHRR